MTKTRRSKASLIYEVVENKQSCLVTVLVYAQRFCEFLGASFTRKVTTKIFYAVKAMSFFGWQSVVIF